MTTTTEPTDYPLSLRAEVRLDERIIGGIIAPFGETIYHPQFGWERYAPGVFNLRTEGVTLKDEDHTTTLGPCVLISERAEGVYAEFRVSETARGDEVLQLALDGAFWGLSAGHISKRMHKDGNVTVHTGSELRHAAVLDNPAYKRAKVLTVRSEPMDEPTPTPQPAPAPTPSTAPAEPATAWATAESVTEMREEMAELQRSVAAEAETTRVALADDPEPTVIRSAGEWIHHAVQADSGNVRSEDLIKRAAEEVPSLRAAAESGATGNYAGAVPPVYLGPIIDRVVAGSPFITALANSGMAHPLPTEGMEIHRPKVDQGTIVAWEGTEGDEGGTQRQTTQDIVASIKALKGRNRLTVQAALRSSPSAIDAMLRDMAAASATEFDAAALNGAGDLNQSTGAMRGVLQTVGIGNTVMAAWNTGALLDALAAAEELVMEATNSAAAFIVMRTRRFSRLRALRDNDGRPIMNIGVAGSAAHNAAGMASTPGMGSALGGPRQPVAELFGYSVVLDNNVPNNLGGGTEDAIVMVGADSFELFHEGRRQAQLQSPDDFQTTYGTLKMGALIPTRPDGLCSITGAGLAA